MDENRDVGWRIKGIIIDAVFEIVEDLSFKYPHIEVSPTHSMGWGATVRAGQVNVFRNVWVLRELGVPQKMLFSMLTTKDNKLVSGKRRFKETIKKVLDKDFDPTKPKFVEAGFSTSESTNENNKWAFRAMLGPSSHSEEKQSWLQIRIKSSEDLGRDPKSKRG
ncbi:hypothetical protein ISN44_As09g011320 [Arabidopsis suecica]|uniref:Uncharacterized protein n=1 Tax=Arabidopsis suecica TaxID=45249 RepID=A0A8T2AIH9_ARASU|nr:hypothetical protein ISN44_As09g011320 [Arabidopsis suecica]